MQMLNAEQRTATNAIVAAVATNDSTSSLCFFIDGPGGTRKTFLYTTIVHVLLGMHKKVLTVAFTGLAAILLPDGKTCHIAFRLPLNIQGDSTCHLSVDEKKNLKDFEVIIWNEAPMASSDVLITVDCLLRNMTRNEAVPFGGRVMVLGDDFRQVLPVVQKGTKQKIIDKCIKDHSLMRHCLFISLPVNMRERAEEVKFAH